MSDSHVQLTYYLLIKLISTQFYQYQSFTEIIFTTQSPRLYTCFALYAVVKETKQQTNSVNSFNLRLRDTVTIECIVLQSSLREGKAALVRIPTRVRFVVLHCNCMIFSLNEVCSIVLKLYGIQRVSIQSEVSLRSVKIVRFVLVI